jgi:hypothetical protein
MAVRNMGTATMRFKEGIKIEGDSHASANQLVITGSMTFMDLPTGSDTRSYINFEGASFDIGSNGFGFRNDGGILEYKDDGGSWATFDSLIQSPAGNNRAIQFNNNGSFGAGNFFYGTNANVGIGDFTNGDPDYLLEIQGDTGGSGNAGQVAITDRGLKPPKLLFQRSAGSLGTETALSDGDEAGALQWRAFDGTNYINVARIRSMVQVDLNGVGSSLEIWNKSTSDSSHKVASFLPSNTLEFPNGYNVIESNNDNGDIVLNKKLAFTVEGAEVGAASSAGIQGNALYSKGVLGIVHVPGDSGYFGTADSRSSCILFNTSTFQPHSDTVTSNIGSLNLGAPTGAWSSLYSEEIRGPSGVDIKVKSDNDTTIMHIGTQGVYANNVGIGNTTPEYPLVVQGTSNADPDAQIINATDDGPTLALTRENSSMTDIEAGQTLGTLTFGASVGTLGACNIKSKATTTWAAGFTPSRSSEISFETSIALEGNIAVAERMTIDAVKVHCKDDLECDGDMTVGNDLDVTLSAEIGSNLTINGDMYTNEWYSNNGPIGITNSWKLASYTDISAAKVTINPSSEDLSFQYRDTNGYERLKCDSDGTVYLGTSSGSPNYSGWDNSIQGVWIEGYSSGAGSVATIANRSESDESDGLRIIVGKGAYMRLAIHNDDTWYYGNTEDNAYIKFLEKWRGYFNDSTEADAADPDGLTSAAAGFISGDGSGGIRIHGDTFTGTHDVSSSEDIDIGLIVESTGDLWINDNISCSLPYVKKSTIENSKTVFGVVSDQTIRSNRAYRVPEGFNPYTVNSLGEGKVWITTLAGEPSNGDYITTSGISGYGQLQADDILHSYTVAKLTEAVNWSAVVETIDYEGNTYKKYLAGCTYHCG